MMMIKLPHSIRKQTIEVAVDSEAVALALQPRLADINRRYFLPVIERVMDELAASGNRLRVDKVEVELGALPFDGFEAAAAGQLYRELRSALEALLREQDAGVNSNERSQSEPAPMFDLLESYLVRGALPFWAPRASAPSLRELIGSLIDDDPSSVVALIRRHGNDTHVLERLALQLDDALLERLVNLLEPEHAALIVAYMIDLKKVHTIEPVVALSNREFSQLLWVLALVYLVQDAGSQFNRKSFVRHLLRGMARSEAVDYAGILITLQRGLEETGTRISLKSSLPGIINELVKELDGGVVESDHPAHGEHQSGKSREFKLAELIPEENDPDRDPASRAGAIEPGPTQIENEWDGLIRMIRGHASRRGEIERMVAKASEDHLQDLLERLDPEHSALIIAYMIDLREIHRVEHVPPVSERHFDRLLWMLVLAFEAHDPGSQFNRGSFVKSLLEGIAESEGLDYRELVRAMRLGLAETQKRGWIKSSLPAVIDKLWGDLGDETERSASASLRIGRESYDETRAQFDRPAQSTASPYDRYEIIRYYLTHGTLPWPALVEERAMMAEAAVTPLLTLSVSQVRALFSHESFDDRRLAVLRAVEALGEEAAPVLIARLLTHTEAPSGSFFQALSQFAEQAYDRRQFFARTISAILEGGPVDLEALVTSANGPSSSHSALSDALINWQPHLLKAVIAAHLRAADLTGAEGNPFADALADPLADPLADLGHPLPDLIHALVARHPQDARHFFYEIRDVEALSSALVDQCDPSLFEEVLEFLRPAEIEAVNALMRAIASIPAPYRPASDESVPRVLFRELISLGQQQTLGEAFFLRVIRSLFATPLSESVSSLLLSEADAWACGDPSLAEHSSALERAVRAAGVRANGGSHEEHDVAEEIEPVVQRALSLLDVILDFLAGRTIAPESRLDAAAQGRSERDAISSDALLHALLVLLDESPDAVSSFIAREAGDRQTRERWVRMLPESVLVRISYLLAPRRHRVMMETAEVLASAWIEAAPSGHPRLTGREELWLFLLEFFSKDHGSDVSLPRLVSALCNHYAARYQAISPVAADRATVGARLLERAEQLACVSGRTSLRDILQSDRARLLESWKSKSEAVRSHMPERNLARIGARSGETKSSPSRRRTRFGLSDDPADGSRGEPIYIGNAGLVLANPFLPHLFRSLDVIEQNESGRTRLRDRQAISRASHLLQYLVDGRASTPEPLLVLNKILCGAPVAAPIEGEIDPSGEEMELCERLLKSIISNWKIIQNTSIAGLRETFLQREGRLERFDDGWKLRVQRKTVDVLVDQVPWNVSVVYHDWMSQPIHVTW